MSWTSREALSPWTDDGAAICTTERSTALNKLSSGGTELIAACHRTWRRRPRSAHQSGCVASVFVYHGTQQEV